MLGDPVATPAGSVYLVSPRNARDWTAYHDIRRRVLFTDRGSSVAYDENHPHDRLPGNYPKLLIAGTEYLGAIRVDIREGIAFLRRVAIDTPFQRKGFGTRMIELAESFALEYGALRVESDVAKDAVDFYLKCGYHYVDGTVHHDDAVSMYKHLRVA
jgi:GNAT superfamily N-acetyltransferase